MKRERYRLHGKAFAPSQTGRAAATSLRAETESVAPLPADILRSESLLSLQGADSGHAQRRKGRKKDRIKIKKEHWLQSQFEKFPPFCPIKWLHRHHMKTVYLTIDVML